MLGWQYLIDVDQIRFQPRWPASSSLALSNLSPVSHLMESIQVAKTRIVICF